MTRPLIITPRAETDLTEAKAWYDSQCEGLGDRFLLCVEEALDCIRRLPDSATQVLPGVRRFPYSVFYRVDPDQIAVLAVYHGKRDPTGWKDRL